MEVAIKISVITSLYRCEKFLATYLEAVSRMTNLHECEFILVHNDPTIEELNIINNFNDRNVIISHLIVEREGLYSSWNRAIRSSRGKYLTVWNVDDVRFADSISLQAKALDDDPKAAIAYGDMYGSSVYGETSGQLYRFPEWKQNQFEFYRSYLMSCFQMWRKVTHEKVGYYDEQFRCVGDFDFQIRTAMHYPFVKVGTPLGIYLEDQPHKISNNGAQVLENNIVYWRYGVYEKIQFHLLFKSLAAYRKSQFLFFGKWFNNAEKSPFSIGHKIKGMAKGMFAFPLHFSKFLVKRYLA